MYEFLYCYMGLELIAVVACLSVGTFGKNKLYVCVFTIYVSKDIALVGIQAHIHTPRVIVSFFCYSCSLFSSYLAFRWWRLLS